MNDLSLLHVVGARPNNPKHAPVHRAAAARGITQCVVHTGQHYDDALWTSLLRDLGQPAPDVDLGVGSASHSVQTARIMEGLEPVIASRRPTWVVVYGDVNSTLAATLVAAKLGIPTAHVEAGLRSGDRSMPEEINRLVADRLASLLLTPSRDADETLKREGVAPSSIRFVGNVMIDSVVEALPRARAMRPPAAVSGRHVLATLHRPSNVDDPVRLGKLLAALTEIAVERPVIFPVHPRTRARLADHGHITDGITLVDPLPYTEMLAWLDSAHAVVTDSGGIQEESTALGVPCLTVRDNTERPITITEGTNQLVRDPAALPALIRMATRSATPRRPDGWDGLASERIVDALIDVAEELAAPRANLKVSRSSPVTDLPAPGRWPAHERAADTDEQEKRAS
jgi:UDP-N-acetylglucosamine 2-epimerase (non-hydrolysing)